jgi:hypothetical protein
LNNAITSLNKHGQKLPSHFSTSNGGSSINPSKEDLRDPNNLNLNTNSVSDSQKALRFEPGIGLVSNDAMGMSQPKKRRRSKRKKSKKGGNTSVNSQFEISTRNIRELVGHSHNIQESSQRGAKVRRNASIDKIKHDDNNNNYNKNADNEQSIIVKDD